MDSYGVEGLESNYGAEEGDGGFIRVRPNLLQATFGPVLIELERAQARFDEALRYLNQTSEQQIYCRCNFIQDPNCPICKAKAILSQWEASAMTPHVKAG